MPSFRYVWPALALLLMGSACSNEADSNDDAACTGRSCDDGGSDPRPDDDSGGSTDPDGGTPDACEASDDCGAGRVCNPTLGICVEGCASDSDCGPAATCTDGGFCTSRPPCTVTTDCGAGTICNSCLGVCTAPSGGTACTSDANCGFDEFCDACVGRCLPRLGLCEPCNDDSQCGEAADLCLDYASGGRFCGTACGSCPIGYTCSPTLGQCVATSGSCASVRECTTPDDCPRGQTCSATFVCVAGCTADEACPGEQVCQAGACVDPCVDDSACPAGATCTEGRCVLPGGCLSSRDCPEAQTFCDPESRTCVPGCQTDIDCGLASLECIDGTCEERGCVGNYACAFDEVCDLGTGECQPAVGPYCDPCNGDDIDSCGATNACVGFEDDDGADAGDFCLVACAADPANPCPQGYGCQELDLGEGDIRRVCVRQCPRDPA